MSWDAAVVLPNNRDLSAVFETAADLQCLPMGSVSELRTLIERVLGNTDWSNGIEGRFVTAGGGLLKLCLETEEYLCLLVSAYEGEDVDEAMAERLNGYRPHDSEQVTQIVSRPGTAVTLLSC